MNVISINIISILILLLVIILRCESFLLRCPPLKIQSAAIRYGKKYSGSARIRCNTNYFLVGNNIVYCHHGKWEGDIPICVSKRSKCKNIESIPNGHVFKPSRYNNTVVSFSCNAGYKLMGLDTLYCKLTTWSSILPQCVKSDGSNKGTSCDFESPDLCGWTQDINHDFDWKRVNSVSQDGVFSYKPKSDHTNNDPQGHYMHIQSLSAERGEVARLFSPFYNIENYTCFEFYYDMYGSLDAALQVYVRQESQSVDKITPTFTGEPGTRMDKWIRAVIELNNITEPFQIIIEGIKGQSSESNIAIDDVRLLNNCQNEDEWSTIEPRTSTDMFDGLSCNGRCNSFDSHPGEKCQCDPSCIDANICCPDYFQICLAFDESVSEFTTEDDNEQTTYPTTSTIKRTSLFTTLSPTIPTNQSTSSTRSNILRTTTTTTTTTTTAQPKKQTSTKATTSFTMKSTRIRTFATSSTSTTTKQPIKISDDMITIPFRSDPDDDESKMDFDSFVSEDSIEPKTVYHWYIVIVVSILAIIMIIVFVAKYINNVQKQSKKNENWNESATDVQYLTSDEILNFTLATPSKDSDRLLEDS